MKRSKPVNLSVIVPAYNEAATVIETLTKLLEQPEVKQVVVVNDASTDNTADKVKSVRSNKIRLVNHQQNQGKGAAIRTGLAEVAGDYVLIQDADLEYDPQDIPQMLKFVLDGKAEVVYGSRFTGPRKNMFFWHMVGNRFLNLVVNILYNTTISDMETCYKLIPVPLFKQLNIKENDFAIEPEVTCKLLNRGIFIFETPISYNGRTFEEGKKLTWKDGFKALYVIIKLRLLGSTS
jgi:glycosyltransferase involved in cell wall biosynthesis